MNMTNQRNSKIGIFWAAVSVLCWGTLFPATSFLMKRGNVDCYSAGQFRFITAGIIMLGAYMLINRTLPIRGISLKDWACMIFISAFSSCMSCALFFGQSLGIPVVNAAMVEAEAPLLIFILGIFILHNKAGLLQVLGFVSGTGGSLLVLKILNFKGFAIESFSTGDLMVLFSAICWALYTVFSNRSINRVGGLLYSAWSLLFAGIWILLFQLSFGLPIHFPKELPDITAILYLGMIPSALAFFSWNNAQRYISTGLLAISGYFTPVLTALFGLILFGESINLTQCFGMVLVFGSALIEPETANLFLRKNNKS